MSKKAKGQNDQIIVRLPIEKKEQLQVIADELKTDMSKLIRDKIDEIIKEHNLKTDNRRFYNEAIDFVDEKTKKNTIVLEIVDDKTISHLRGEFEKMMMEKMKSEIGEVSFSELFKK